MSARSSTATASAVPMENDLSPPSSLLLPPGDADQTRYVQERFNDQMLLIYDTFDDFPPTNLQQLAAGRSAGPPPPARQRAEPPRSMGEGLAAPKPEADKVTRRIQRKDKHRRIEHRRRRSERKLFDNLRQVLGAEGKHRVAVLEECLLIVQNHQLQKADERLDLFSAAERT